MDANQLKEGVLVLLFATMAVLTTIAAVPAIALWKVRGMPTLDAALLLYTIPILLFAFSPNS